MYLVFLVGGIRSCPTLTVTRSVYTFQFVLIHLKWRGVRGEHIFGTTYECNGVGCERGLAKALCEASRQVLSHVMTENLGKYPGNGTGLARG